MDVGIGMKPQRLPLAPVQIQEVDQEYLARMWGKGQWRPISAMLHSPYPPCISQTLLQSHETPMHLHAPPCTLWSCCLCVSSRGPLPTKDCLVDSVSTEAHGKAARFASLAFAPNWRLAGQPANDFLRELTIFCLPDSPAQSCSILPARYRRLVHQP